MMINCAHGYFKIFENRPGEVSKFMSLTELSLVQKGDYFTFEFLAAAPEYALAGKTYLGAPVTVSIAGKPWEIMRANSLVYDFNTDLVVPISTITRVMDLKTGSDYYFSDGLLVPGSLNDDGQRIKDFLGWFSTAEMRFRYSAVNFD